MLRCPSTGEDRTTKLPKKIRVYELARELGLTNKEALDICIDLGIGVKSHSSSIEDAQADRARRKADREGLRRAVQPEEAAPAPTATSSSGAGLHRSASAPTERPGAVPAAAALATAPAPTRPVPAHGVASRPAVETPSVTHEPRPGQRLVVSKSASEVVDAPRTSLPRPPVPPPPGAPRPAPAGGTVRTGSAPAAPLPRRPVALGGAAPTRRPRPGRRAPATDGHLLADCCPRSGAPRCRISRRGPSCCRPSGGCRDDRRDDRRRDDDPGCRSQRRRRPSGEPVGQADPAAPRTTAFDDRPPDPAATRCPAAVAFRRPGHTVRPHRVPARG